MNETRQRDAEDLQPLSVVSDTDGLVFDKYRVLRRLAIGGMGEIFLARELRPDVERFERFVVLKSLLPELLRDPEFIEQFLDEARVAASLNHPNIISIYEVGAWKGNYLLALEHIDGLDLAKLLQSCRVQRKPVAPAIVAKVIRDAASALHHAHFATDLSGKPLNVIHRDVSPSNIMVRRDGVVKVVDFGVAKAANRISRTSTGKVKGKLSYMSPEQIQMEELDHRSDQFGLGVVLWELLTCERLFQGLSEFMTFDRILNQKTPKPSAFARNVPDALEEVAMRMLSKDRDARYEDCQQVAAALDDVLLGWGETPGEREVAEAIAPHTTRLESGDSDADTAHLSIAPDDWVRRASDLVEPGDQKPSRRWLVFLGTTLCVVLGGGAFTWFKAQSASPAAATTQERAPAFAQYQLDTEPAGAQVFLDDEHLGTSPYSMSALEPGTHRLRVEKEGFVVIERQIDVKAGEQKTLLLTLEGQAKIRTNAVKPAAPPRARSRTTTVRTARPSTTADGTLTLNTKPWTRIFVDGEMIGVTPVFKVALPPGRHQSDSV
ncbi:MAG: serine/threonine-protein kinase, partial [Myxococcota bacterium]